MPRRLTVAVALYALLFGVAQLVPDSGGTSGHINPTSLISFGFLIIAAFAAGDIAERVGIPRITAYFATGLLLGPDMTGLVDRQLIGAVHHFPEGANALPLVLIAISLMGLRAGAGIRIQDAAKEASTLAAVIGLQVVAVMVITAILVAVALRIGLAPGAPVAVFSVLAAICALGASPAATVGVLDETGSRGPVGHFALVGATVRELLVPVLFVFALLAAGLGVPDQLVPWVALMAGIALGGALLGVRWLTGRDTPLLTITLAFVVALVFAPTMRYGPFLLFVVAGIVLANSHRVGARIQGAIGAAATPVYVFFFTAVGAAFPLDEAGGATALAGLLLIARFLGLWVGCYYGGRYTGMPKEASNLAGLATVPHAGVTIALALVVGEVLPEHGALLRNGVLGAVVLSELVGPVIMRGVLAAVGEYTPPGREQHVEEELPPIQRILEVGPELPAPPADLPDAVAAPLMKLQAAVQSHMDDFADALAGALMEGPFAFVARLEEAIDEDANEAEPADEPGDRAARLRAWCAATRRYSAEAHAPDVLQEAMQSLLNKLDEAIGELRPTSVGETDADRAALASDSRLARAQKAGLRLLAAVGLRQRARRIVRLDHLARYYLSAPLPGRLVPIANLAMRGAVLPLPEVRRRVSDPEGLRAPDPVTQDSLKELGNEVLARGMLLFADAMEELYDAARRAGTPSLRQRQYNPSRRFEENRAGRRRLTLTADRWRMATRARAGRLVAMLEAVQAQPPIAECFERASARTEALLGEALVTPIRRLAAEVANTMEAVEQVLGLDAARRRDALGSLRDDLLERQTRLRSDLNARNNRGDLTQLLRTLWDDLTPTIEALSETLTVPAVDAELPAEGLTPSEKTAAGAPLPVRAVARAAIIDESQVGLLEVEERVNALVERARSTLAHTAQVIRFHLDAAASELEGAESPEQHALAREFARGGLERVAERLRDELEVVESARKDLVVRIQREGERAPERLQRLLVEETPGQAELYAASRRSPSPARAPRPAEPVGPSPLRRALSRFRPLAALLTGGEDEAAADIGSFPFRAAARATLAHAGTLGLPETYRRLFSFNPVAIDDFFVGRAAEWDSLRAAMGRWRTGAPTAVLLRGPRGSGRTSLIDRLLRSLPANVESTRAHLSHHVTSERALVRELGASLGFERLQSPKRLIEHLLGRPRPLVFALEPLGRLHLRCRDGLGALAALEKIVSDTADRVLWIAAGDPDGLRAMDALAGVSSVFTHTIDLEPLDAEDVRALVTVRHRASGYKLRFHDAAQGGTSSELELRYFETLRERSHGEPLLAVYQWLRSLRLDETGHTLVVEAPPPLDLGFVARLDTPELLVLAQAHVHAGLTLEDGARVTSLSADGGVRLLRRLAWRHFLDTVEPGLHIVNPVLWPALRQELRQRGVL